MKKSKFQFSNPALIKLIFQENDKFESDKFESIHIEGKTKVLKSKEDNLAIVELSLVIGGMSAEFPFYIEATMKADFKWENELEMELVDNLLKSNAPSLILGYMRPVIANITNVSEYPVFNIPFIDMQENKVIIEEVEL